MSTNIKYAQTGASGALMGAGTYPAVCVGVIDFGIQKIEWQGTEKEQPKILLMWELSTETVEYNGEIKPRLVFKEYTFSTHEKALLRKDLMSWRGRDFTADELNSFDISNVLGAPCLVTISQNIKNGKIYYNVTAVSKLMNGLEVPKPSRTLHFDIDDESTWTIFTELPRFAQDKINGSVTFQQRDIFIGKDGTISKPASVYEPANFEEIAADADLPF